MQKLKIDVLKIDKTALYKGAKGTYLDLTLMDNRDGRDQYDNDGFIIQDIGKQRREAGEKGPIIGNWKHTEQRAPAALPPPLTATKWEAETPPQDDEDIPF